MSEADDEYFRRLDDEQDEDGQAVACKRCGTGGLMWDQHHHDATGKWRLWEGEWPDGRVHRCPAAADFSPIPEAP